MDPAAVAITGGTIIGTTIEGVADTAVLGTQLLNVWAEAQARFLHTKIPALTAFRRVPFDFTSTAAVAPGESSGDAEIPGGAATGPGGQYRTFNPTIIDTPKVSSWGLAGLVKMASPAAGGIDNEFGLVDVAGSAASGVVLASKNASSATKWVLTSYNGASPVTVVGTTNATAGWHTFAITFDTTTVKGYVDGTLEASNADLSKMPTTPCVLHVFNGSGGQCIVADMVFGYVQPT